MHRDTFENVSDIPDPHFCSKVANMESASFSIFPRHGRGGWKHAGSVKKSVDLFAFAITHLSWLDRYLTQFGMTRHLKPWFVPHILDRVRGYAWSGTPYHSAEVQRAADATLVLMPFFATPDPGLGDAGHSSLDMRRAFLAMTVRGVSHFFKHVTVCVGTDFDERYARNESGLPFFDVMRVPGGRMGMHVRHKGVDPSMPFKAGCMGLATIHMAKVRLANDPRYGFFRYVYYTESDQLPHVRGLGHMLRTLQAERDKGTWAVFTPHRLVPLMEAPEITRNATKLETQWVAQRARFLGNVDARHAPKQHHEVADLREPTTCCFERADCDRERPNWVNVTDPRLHVLRFATAPFAVLAGEPDFHAQTYRPCTVSDRARCP